jgi:hypothetical protein
MCVYVLLCVSCRSLLLNTNGYYACAGTRKNESASTENVCARNVLLTVTIFNLKYLLYGSGRK